MTDNDWTYDEARTAMMARSEEKSVATEETNTEAHIETPATSMAPMAKHVAEAVNAYYEGLGDGMPEPLKEQLTKDFAAEIDRAVGARIAAPAKGKV